MVLTLWKCTTIPVYANTIRPHRSHCSKYTNLSVQAMCHSTNAYGWNTWWKGNHLKFHLSTSFTQPLSCQQRWSINLSKSKINMLLQTQFTFHHHLHGHWQLKRHNQQQLLKPLALLAQVVCVSNWDLWRPGLLGNPQYSRTKWVTMASSQLVCRATTRDYGRFTSQKVVTVVPWATVAGIK